MDSHDTGVQEFHKQLNNEIMKMQNDQCATNELMKKADEAFLARLGEADEKCREHQEVVNQTNK